MALKEILPYEQQLSYSCGPASLLMLYRFHDIQITEEQINQEMNLTSDGASWDQMIRHIHRKGFFCEFKRNATYDELLPYAIVCYQSDRIGEPGSHFSVIYTIDDQSITLADPSLGDFFTYHRDIFMNKWHDDEGKYSYISILSPESQSVHSQRKQKIICP